MRPEWWLKKCRMNCFMDNDPAVAAYWAFTEVFSVIGGDKFSEPSSL